MEGVYPPRLRDLRVDKENQEATNANASHQGTSTRKQVPHVGREKRTNEKVGGKQVVKSKELEPMEVDSPKFDNEDDDIIED